MKNKATISADIVSSTALNVEEKKNVSLMSFGIAILLGVFYKELIFRK
jgi:hypothetical protein